MFLKDNFIKSDIKDSNHCVYCGRLITSELIDVCENCQHKL